MKATQGGSIATPRETRYTTVKPPVQQPPRSHNAAPSRLGAPDAQPVPLPVAQELPAVEHAPVPAPASNIGEGTRFESWAE